MKSSLPSCVVARNESGSWKWTPSSSSGWHPSLCLMTYQQQLQVQPASVTVSCLVLHVDKYIDVITVVEAALMRAE
jgi:hypothetical protein